MTKRVTYLAIIERGQTGYGAYVPDLPGCIAAAASQEEVAALIQEAVEFHVQGLREDGLPLPTPTCSAAFVRINDDHQAPEA